MSSYLSRFESEKNDKSLLARFTPFRLFKERLKGENDSTQGSLRKDVHFSTDPSSQIITSLWEIGVQLTRMHETERTNLSIESRSRVSSFVCRVKTTKRACYLCLYFLRSHLCISQWLLFKSLDISMFSIFFWSSFIKKNEIITGANT